MEGSDAASNLEGALYIASSVKLTIPEVCIYMDGVLMRGNRTIKVSNR
jgi:L-asparaginase/Glu-tRNA(Gln) amidotransferase subunit D